MTARIGSTRRRRTALGVNIPRDVADWFGGLPRPAGSPAVPWRAMAFPGYVHVAEWWQAWLAAHPDAVPPASHKWLADLADRRHRPPAFIVAAARKTGADS